VPTNMFYSCSTDISPSFTSPRFANIVNRFGDVMFRFSDQHGEMMSLNTYAKYIINPEGLSDDSPLGIYDSEFGDDDATKEVLLEYSVPSCFSQDLFELADDGMDEIPESGEEEQSRVPRPPFRWILIGPERSGTGMHVDPLWTNAWVTVLQGLKRWLLFPPDTPHDVIGMVNGKPQIPSSIWFHDYYDRVTSSSWPECYRPVEVLQHPGETVFVPAGWPHLVLNLKLTVAVTHNYAAEFGPFSRMWDDVKYEEPEFFSRWCSGLQKHGRAI
jgi:histone arginine demethylase JMJD6